MYRWMVLVVLVSGIGTSGYFRRRAYRTGSRIARSAESKAMMAGRALLALPLLFMMLTYVAYPSLLEWAGLPLPEAFRLGGFVLGLASVAGAGWTLHNLGRNVSETVLTKEGQALVATGPYRWVRHPLYTSGLGMILGIGLMAANGLILAWWALIAVAVHMVVIPREERALVERFGAEYTTYQRETGRLVPRL